MSLEKSELLKLFELAVDEEIRWTASHQERVTFYTGLFTAIIAGIAAGLFQATEWFHFVALAAGALVLFVITGMATQGTEREYQRLLEAIVFRAKIEQELGLTTPSSHQSATQYWPTESFVATRHLKSRTTYPTSDAFVKENVKKGYQGITIALFAKLRWMSGFLIMTFMVIALWKFLQIYVR